MLWNTFCVASLLEDHRERAQHEFGARVAGHRSTNDTKDSDVQFHRQEHEPRPGVGRSAKSVAHSRSGLDARSSRSTRSGAARALRTRTVAFGQRRQRTLYRQAVDNKRANLLPFARKPASARPMQSVERPYPSLD